MSPPYYSCGSRIELKWPNSPVACLYVCAHFCDPSDADVRLSIYPTSKSTKSLFASIGPNRNRITERWKRKKKKDHVLETTSLMCIRVLYIAMYWATYMHRFCAAKHTAAYKYAYHCCGYCHAKKWVTRCIGPLVFATPFLATLRGGTAFQAMFRPWTKSNLSPVSLCITPSQGYEWYWEASFSLRGNLNKRFVPCQRSIVTIKSILSWAHASICGWFLPFVYSANLLLDAFNPLIRNDTLPRLLHHYLIQWKRGEWLLLTSLWWMVQHTYHYY